MARVWVVCCSIGAGAGLLSCGGRATDGVEPEPNDGVGDSTSLGPNSDDAPPRVRPVRETCADNPLLAGCPSARPADPPSPVEVEVEVEDEEQPQDDRIGENVLASHCGPCHGPALTPDQASAGINYIDDWERLFDVGLIECAPGRSRIVQVMRRGEMPPAMSGLTPVPDPDIDFVELEIERSCTGE